MSTFFLQEGWTNSDRSLFYSGKKTTLDSPRVFLDDMMHGEDRDPPNKLLQTITADSWLDARDMVYA